MKALMTLLTMGALLMSGCTKEPGEGGKALIRGTVLEQEYNDSNGQPVGTPYPAQEHKVYIVYGDNEFYDDDVDTGPDGEYEFRWLRKGTYTIFVYSELCKNCNDTEVIRTTVEISDRNEVVDVPTLTVDWWD